MPAQRPITRRQLLRGAFGFTLALPFLPSLLPREAKGQELPRQPRFLAMTTDHGGIFESVMYPDDALLTGTLDVHSGMTIRHGALARTVEGSTARLSGLLSAPADRLTESLTRKMNVLRGLDIPFYIAHHSGGHLGNYARNDGNGADGKEIQDAFMPTIDQLMAWSDTFYPDRTAIKERSITVGPRGGLSWNWSNPSARQGEIQQVRTDASPLSLFRQVFVPDDPEGPEPRPLIVDRVVESYRSLRQSNARLSASDRQRLDDHMDRLAELERRINARPVSGAACHALQEPSGGQSPLERLHALTDVIAAAFICGSCRVAVLGVIEAELVGFAGDWHQDVAHQWSSAGPQDLLQQANRAAFSEVFLGLAAKLDVEDIPGRTVLDDTLMTWSQESGEETHDARSIPVITLGSAAGKLNTGLYVDYRNRTPGAIVKAWGEEKGYTGLLYSQWLATCLQAMGLPASEWQTVRHNGPAGYGHPQVSPDYAPTYVSGVVEGASSPLPVIWA